MSKHRSVRHDRLTQDFDELAGELRVLGLLQDTPRPSAARRAELRAAVLARRNERARTTPGSLRGLVIGAAMVTGGGMVIASAAGGGNPASFVADIVRDIGVPVTGTEQRALPIESPAGAAVARPPQDEPAAALETPTAEPTRPAVETRPATPEPAREGTAPPPTASARANLSNTDTRGDDTLPTTVAPSETYAVATDPTNTPTALKPDDAVLSNAGSATPRTTAPTGTPTPTPTKAASEVAPVTNSVPITPTPTATPTPEPTRPTADNTLEPLTQDADETNASGSSATVR